MFCCINEITYTTRWWKEIILAFDWKLQTSTVLFHFGVRLRSIYLLLFFIFLFICPAVGCDRLMRIPQGCWIPKQCYGNQTDKNHSRIFIYTYLVIKDNTLTQNKWSNDFQLNRQVIYPLNQLRAGLYFFVKTNKKKLYGWGLPQVWNRHRLQSFTKRRFCNVLCILYLCDERNKCNILSITDFKPPKWHLKINFDKNHPLRIYIFESL